MSSEIKVVLRASVENLGTVGDLVKVKTGFARNYLLPRGLAYPLTPENLRRIDVEKERLRLEEARRIQTVRALADRLATTSVTIEAKAEGAKLFGSVTAQMIAEALRDQKGLDIPVKAVRLENPIKEIGVYDVPVHLQAEIEVNTKVWVVEARA